MSSVWVLEVLQYIWRQLTVNTDKLAPTMTWRELKDLARQWLGEPIQRTEEYGFLGPNVRIARAWQELMDISEKSNAYSDESKFIGIAEWVIFR